MPADAHVRDEPDHGVVRHDIPPGGRSGFLRVNDRQVHYLEWGAGDAPAVLALHGGGQTGYMYEDLGAALRETHHVLAPDFPNHGESDSFSLETALSRHALADGLPPLLDEFGIERVVVVGASLGGMTAITLAAAQPDRVAGIVLIDVGHRLEDEGVERIITFMRAHESFADLDEAADAIAEYLPHRPKAPTERLTRNLRQRSDGRWVWKHGLGRMPDGPTRNWRAILEGLDDDARSLDVPTLVLRGASSDVLSAEGADEVTSLIKGARLAEVGSAGHLAAGDNPRTTVALVQGFLAELDW
jgi:pimeloyl-ACP methyl ester carboxylesterase